MILNGIFEIFDCPMIILEIYDQKWAGIALLGNSRVLKCYRDCLNLGHSVVSRCFRTLQNADKSDSEGYEGYEKFEKLFVC